MNRYVQELRTDWLYIPRDYPAAIKRKCDEGKFRRVSLPHTNVELPYHNFSEQEHCFVSWYRRWFRVPKHAKGRRVFLDFGAVMIAATVYVNGKQVGDEHKGGYTPFSFDITDHVRIGEDNLVSVRVDSTERKDIPPFGFVVDYLTFGGIYREVELRIVDPLYIRNITARPREVRSDRKGLDVIVQLVNTAQADRTVSIRATLTDGKGKKIRTVRDTATVLAGKEACDAGLRFDLLPGIKLWNIDDPNLYHLSVAVEDEDEVSTRIGFRTAEFREDGSFYLNDKPLKLRGLNRHQTYPYIGQAGPARLQRKDAEILRNEIACNIVRTSHYPQSKHFLDACDEMGLLVLEEIPGWQHIGDEAWKQIALRDVRAMIERDRNRPSIILWGVRINESRDDHDFYVATNELARTLDPTRQTGGIRCNWDSELLEDVYTMNDFGYDLRDPQAPRYMNTEFNGHMYPTKTFDQEERVKEHVLRYAHIYNRIYGMASAGGTGWCAFDYNTHAVFGSGDRICYHGVMDFFRQPKFAAHFYAAFHDPAKKIVLEPATYWKLGDKSGGGVEPLVVLSNCDQIEVFVGEESRGRFGPAKETFPHLPRPPFIVEKIGHTWGGDWKPLRVVGYIDGNAVAERRISNDGVPQKLIMTADDAELIADGSDMTRISLRITDEFDNILPFAMQPVFIEIDGPGEIVGDNPFPMPGGRGAVYIRTRRKPGAITITATTQRLPQQRLRIKVRKYDGE